MDYQNSDIAALCVNRRSIYKKIGLDCYDEDRDTYRFPGGKPVIAHPPCRGYSTFLRHSANHDPSEKALAILCLDWLLQYGGVLEHPAHSKFFTEVLGLRPGRTRAGIQLLEINQEWFGYCKPKKTWLAVPTRYSDIPEIPFRLCPRGTFTEKGGTKTIGYRRWTNLTKSQRSETTYELAIWLIELVRRNI